MPPMPMGHGIQGHFLLGFCLDYAKSSKNKLRLRSLAPLRHLRSICLLLCSLTGGSQWFGSQKTQQLVSQNSPPSLPMVDTCPGCRATWGGTEASWFQLSLQEGTERGEKRWFQWCIWEVHPKVGRNGFLFSTLCNYIPFSFGSYL